MPVVLRQPRRAHPIRRDLAGNMLPTELDCECNLDELDPPVPEPTPGPEVCPDRIENYTQFKDYVLSRLGAPVVCVEVDDMQIQNSIDDVILMAQRYLGREGNYEAIIPLKMLKGIGEYYIDAPIQSVIKVIGPMGPAGILNWFSAEHHLLYPALLSGNMFRGGMGDGGRGILANWESQMQYIKDISMTFDKQYEVNWRAEAKILNVNPQPKEDMEVGLFCYVNEDCLHLYNNIIVRQLAVAAVGRQWARNLLKFSALTLPGGSQIAADALASQYTTDWDYWLTRLQTEGDAMSFAPSFG